ncbi:MAG: bifunctional 3-demethylubiquinol 3-O-methyltransferase/2-polyprenyl-6-hydroxyphenol methylase [Magnetovibrio sp.]|nr:bifunctional 3-demethylubiquinol 3-O-methyltransferase/2-polyprenyl-6-hydroxyphenol methylase [Magnetovibrio sp.]|tara:strand:- start:662 stop:1405 length:744 start_codon:yes stop_codon:yes gene_type:complete
METNNTSTASAQEIARFTAMADAWWDPNGKFKPLHQINPLRIEYIRNLICQHHDRDPKGTKPLNKIKLLDIGCGGGLLCEPMQRLGATVTGIDAGKKNIAIASLHAKQSGLKINYCHQLPEDLTKTKDTFDVVLNMEVIEHVKNVDTFLKSSVSLVKPGGLMVLSTINRTMKSLILAKIGAEYILRWLPVGTHDWRKFVKPSELASGLRSCKVNVTDVTGMVYNPFKNIWSLSDDLSVNYLVSAKKN